MPAYERRVDSRYSDDIQPYDTSLEGVPVRRADQDDDPNSSNEPTDDESAGSISGFTRSEPEVPLASLSAERAQALDELTRIALERLAHPDLLHQLLSRLCAVMDADNAAILLLDDDIDSLTIYSVRGPESAVAKKVRVPVGRGVAGTIFASKAPLVVDDLHVFPVENPFLREHLRSLVGVPLLVDERAIGVLHVDSVRLRHFSQSDVPFLQAIAGRIAFALDHRRAYRLAEQARHQAEAHTRQLDAVFQAMTDAIFVMDREGRVLQMNAASHEMLGLMQPDEYYALPLEERPKQLSTMITPEGASATQETWPAFRILNGEVLTGASAADIMVRRPNGQVLDLSVTGAPIRDENGEIVASVSICRDVTEHRRLERRTRESLDTLLEMAQMLVQPPNDTQPPGAAPADADGADTLMVSGALHSHSSDRNPQQAERMIAHQLALLTKNVLGCSRVAILAVEPETQAMRAVAVVGLETDREAQWWAEQRESEARGFHLGDGADPEVMRRIYAGEPVVIDMTEPPYRDLPNPWGISTTLIAPMSSGGKIVGLLILDFGGPVHAFTADENALASVVAQLGAVALERDRLLHERAQAEAHIIALEDTQARLDTFIGIAGHELKTPLTTALAMGQLAKRRIQALTTEIHRLDDESVQRMEPVAAHLMRMVDQIGVANRRQARLVDDLLDVTRIQSGRLTFTRTPCDLRQVVESAVEEARIQAPARAITLRLPRKSALVYADADRISQVMTNLLTNALKYSAPETSVEVQMRIQKSSQGEVATVRVRDEGVGIPLAEQGAVWTRFHRVSGIQVQSGTGVGLGLGLFISREIVERHGGQVGLSSEPGVGSTFWFSLPLVTYEAAEVSSELWDEATQEPSNSNG